MDVGVSREVLVQGGRAAFGEADDEQVRLEE